MEPKVVVCSKLNRADNNNNIGIRPRRSYESSLLSYSTKRITADSTFEQSKRYTRIIGDTERKQHSSSATHVSPSCDDKDNCRRRSRLYTRYIPPFRTSYDDDKISSGSSHRASVLKWEKSFFQDIQIGGIDGFSGPKNVSASYTPVPHKKTIDGIITYNMKCDNNNMLYNDKYDKSRYRYNCRSKATPDTFQTPKESHRRLPAAMLCPKAVSLSSPRYFSSTLKQSQRDDDVILRRICRRPNHKLVTYTVPNDSYTIPETFNDDKILECSQQSNFTSHPNVAAPHCVDITDYTRVSSICHTDDSACRLRPRSAEQYIAPCNSYRVISANRIELPDHKIHNSHRLAGCICSLRSNQLKAAEKEPISFGFRVVPVPGFLKRFISKGEMQHKISLQKC
eukprot:Tbor_TRINITY_DN1192_c0_g1::TRINITY_DN1192_c0_g1_i1::g.15597::m.15597